MSDYLTLLKRYISAVANYNSCVQTIKFNNEEAAKQRAQHDENMIKAINLLMDNIDILGSLKSSVKVYYSKPKEREAVFKQAKALVNKKRYDEAMNDIMIDNENMVKACDELRIIIHKIIENMQSSYDFTTESREAHDRLLNMIKMDD